MFATELITSAAVGLCSSGVLVASVQAFFNRTTRNAEAERQQSEAQARQHETWFREAEAAYQRVNNECNKCRQELQELRNVTENLIEALAEVIPMLPLDDDRTLKLRVAARAARQVL